MEDNVMPVLTLLSYPPLTFLSAFWFWIYFKRWLRHGRVLSDLTISIWMLSMTYVFGLCTLSRTTDLLPLGSEDFQYYVRAGFSIVTISWVVHTLLMLRRRCTQSLVGKISCQR